MKSIVQQRGQVAFPEHLMERVYMHEFRKETGLPAYLARWQGTVDAMLDGVDTDGPIYLMIDQGIVRAGSSHRRPGVHIDGYWIPAKSAHGGGGGGGHNSRIRHGGGRHIGFHESWANADYREPEAIILASSVTAARALSGEFSGQPGDGGDCSHIDTSALVDVPMNSGIVYAGNVTMLHESIPIDRDCLRTLARLNVPGWTPKKEA